MQYKIKPWKHQLEGIKLAENLDYFALFYIMGKGKTSTAINIYRQKCYKEDRLLRTIILCPLGVIFNWKEEFEKHSYFPQGEVMVLDGRTAAHKIKKVDEGCKILILNTDGVSIKALWDKIINEFKPEFMIVDESHKFKNPSAKRTHAVIKASDKIKYKLLLTGTPILNNEMDIWSQYRILNKNIFGENYYVFRNMYFFDVNSNMPRERYFPNWKIQSELVKDFYSKLKSCAHINVDTSDMPSLVRKRVYVPLGKKQAKLYEEMENDFITFLNDEACEASTALVKGLRLQQLVSGIFANDEGEFIALDDNLRNDYLKEVLEDISHSYQKVIWCVFKETYMQIAKVCEALKIEHDFIIGGQKASYRQDVINRFNTGKLNCIIANQSAGGTGTNLLGHNKVDTIYNIYYSRDFSYEHDKQSEFRSRRRNQEKQVVRIDLIAKNTIDEHMLGALQNKEKLSDAILKFKK